MKTQHRILCLAVVAVLSLGAAGAPAQDAGGASIKGDLNAARPFWDKGGTAYNAGKYTQAAAHFQKAYELYSHPKFLYAVAQSERMAGNHAKAVTAYQRYLKDHPSPISLAYLNMGESLLKLKRRKEADKAFQTFITVDPSNPQVEQARIAIKTGKPPSEQDKRDPNKVKQAVELTNKGIALYNKQQYQQAGDLFRQGWQQLKMPEFLRNAGLSYERAKLWDKAAQAYQEYAKIPGTSIDAWVFLARCRLELFDFIGAYKAYDQYHKVAPVGAAYRSEAGEFLDSINVSQTPSPEDVKRVREFTNKGIEHYNAGRYKQARKCFQDSGFVLLHRSVYFNMALCEMGLKEWKNALQDFRTYLENGDTGRHAFVHLWAAECLINLKALKEADKHVRRYLELADKEDLPGENTNRKWANDLLAKCR